MLYRARYTFAKAILATSLLAALSTSAVAKIPPQSAIAQSKTASKSLPKVVPLFFSTAGAVNCIGAMSGNECQETAHRICNNHGYYRVHKYRIVKRSGSPDSLSALSCLAGVGQ